MAARIFTPPQTHATMSPKGANAMERRVNAGLSVKIDKIVARRTAPVPGLAIVVIKNGQIVHLAGYGSADLETATPITPQTQFHMASCGKQFTALGIMRLKDDGKLGFDDHIGKHIPELAGYPAGVTIRRLLHHVSGIADLYGTRLERKLLALARHPANRHVVKLYAELGCPMGKTAGRFSYSNTGYDLLGSVIERVSGQTYRDFFRARLFAPLGMADTFSLPAAARLARRQCAIGYEKKRSHYVAQPEHQLDGLCGAGSIYSTVADLSVYEAAFAAGRLVSEASMRAALRSGERDDGGATGYGFGWSVTPDFFEHSGGWIGFTAHIRRYRRRRLSIYVLSNSATIDPKRTVAAAARAFW
jgi:CubicO group peptidase (beta-lactamase class C family)